MVLMVLMVFFTIKTQEFIIELQTLKIKVYSIKVHKHNKTKSFITTLLFVFRVIILVEMIRNDKKR